jgi:hypothetical protein
VEGPFVYVEWHEPGIQTRVSSRQLKVKPMLGRVKKLLEQLLVPQKPVPVPVPVRVPRRTR